MLQPFSGENYPSAIKIWSQNGGFLGKRIWEMLYHGYVNRLRQNPQCVLELTGKTRTTARLRIWCARSRACVETKPLWIKFCRMVAIHDLVICKNFVEICTTKAFGVAARGQPFPKRLMCMSQWYNHQFRKRTNTSTTSTIFVVMFNQIKSNLFVTQNYTNPIKDGKIEHCVNRTQRQLRATLTGAQTDIYGKS